MTGRHGAAMRADRIALIAALVLLVAAVLPWYRVVGALPAPPVHGVTGSGVLVLVAAIGTLAAATLPWAIRRDVPAARGALVRWALAALAVLGVLAWPLGRPDLAAGLRPDLAPGFWLAALGAAGLVAAAALARPSERPSRQC